MTVRRFKYSYRCPGVGGGGWGGYKDYLIRGNTNTVSDFSDGNGSNIQLRCGNCFWEGTNYFEQVRWMVRFDDSMPVKHTVFLLLNINNTHELYSEIQAV